MSGCTLRIKGEHQVVHQRRGQVKTVDRGLDLVALLFHENLLLWAELRAGRCGSFG